MQCLAQTFCKSPGICIFSGHFYVQILLFAEAKVSFHAPPLVVLFLWIGTNVDDDFYFHPNVSCQTFVCLADFLKTEMIKGIYITGKKIS